MGESRPAHPIGLQEDSGLVDKITNHGLITRVFGTGAVPFFDLAGGQTLDAEVSPLGADSLSVDIGSVEFHLKVDASGRILGGSIPAQQVVADRTAGS